MDACSVGTEGEKRDKKNIAPLSDDTGTFRIRKAKDLRTITHLC